MGRVLHGHFGLVVPEILVAYTSTLVVVLPVGQLASPLHHVVKGKLGIPHNLAEDSFPQIAFGVDRHSRPAPVGMNEDGMASRLPVQGKATPFQDGNHLPGIE